MRDAYTKYAENVIKHYYQRGKYWWCLLFVLPV